MKDPTTPGWRPRVQVVASWIGSVLALGHVSGRVPQQTTKYNDEVTAEL
jgi:hypothetical protein